MPFKTDTATGAIALMDSNGVKMPIFIGSDGKEVPFDVDKTVGLIASTNGEARSHRVRAETAEASLAKFTGIEDPTAAIEALKVVKNLDLKKLVDAGEIDKVRDEVGKVYKTQVETLTGTNATLAKQLMDLTLGQAFTSSKFIAEKFAIPADFVQARFGGNFKVEEGKVVAYDSNGQKIYKQTLEGAGSLASFDEAMQVLVDAHPQRNMFLKGTGSSGSGSPAGGGAGNGTGGAKTYTRTQLAAMTPAQQHTAVVTEKATIVDG